MSQRPGRKGPDPKTSTRPATSPSWRAETKGRRKPSGGPLSGSVTAAVRVRRVGPDVEFRVDDCGPGIPPDNLERVFERFYTDRPEGSFGSNSGLGLSISKQIVEAHRGRIWAENRYGKADQDGEKPVLGARFTVRIPAVQHA